MLLLPEFFPGATGFQWDEGNAEKNWLQHDVTHAEAEQVFFNVPVLVRGDSKHSAQGSGISLWAGRTRGAS